MVGIKGQHHSLGTRHGMRNPKEWPSLPDQFLAMPLRHMHIDCGYDSGTLTSMIDHVVQPVAT